MHVANVTTAEIGGPAAAVDLCQTPAPLACLSFSASDLSALAEAHARRPGLPAMRLVALRDLAHPMSVDLWIDAVGRHARAICVRILGGHAWWAYGADSLAAVARRHGIALALLPGECSDRDDHLAALSTVAPDELDALKAAFREGGPDNADAALLRLARLAGADVVVPPVRPVARCGYWDPSSGIVGVDYFLREAGDGTTPRAPAPSAVSGRSAPAAAVDRAAIGKTRTGPSAAAATAAATGCDGARVLVPFYRSLLLSGDVGPIAALAAALCARGMVPVPVFVPSLKGADVADFLAAAAGALAPEAIVTTTAFAAAEGDAAPLFEALGVPVLQAALATTAHGAWERSPRGLVPADVAMHVVLPEIDGRVFAGAVSFRPDPCAERDGPHQFRPERHVAEPSRVALVADRVAALVRLARTPRAERRLAIVVPDYPGAEGRTGYAVGLDVPASVLAMLHDLSAAGYRIEDIPDTPRALMALLRTPHPALSAAAARAAFAALPPAARDRVAAAWGDPGGAAGVEPDDPHQTSSFLAQVPHGVDHTVRDVHAPASARPDATPLAAGRMRQVHAPALELRGQGVGGPARVVLQDHAPALDSAAVSHRLLQPERGPSAPGLRQGQGAARSHAQRSEHGEDGRSEPLDAAAVRLTLALPFWPSSGLNGCPSARAGSARGDPSHATKTPARSAVRTNRNATLRLRHARFGNAVVVLAPDRGRLAERRADYHSPELPPTPELLAFGAFLRGAEDVHAVVHVGAHGTIEWLPGKAVALSPACFPELVLGALPVIYPFIVSNPGEAAQAKRRIAAVTLGHLPPPLVGDGLSDDAAALERLVDEYAAADGLDAGRRVRLERVILAEAARTGLDRAAGVAESGAPGAALKAIDAWLCDLKDFALKDGQHVYGRPDPVPPADPAEAARRADSATAERAALVAALDGRFVAPGPSGSPERGRGDVHPTGRNLYALDPRALPTPTAFTVGATAADEVVRFYAQEHGEPPRSLVLDLWGSATLRTGGEEIAQALALMGCRPRWDYSSGRVVGVEVQPVALVGRPRVDVSLRVSGLFRDMFPAQVALLVAAADAVAAREYEGEDNPLAVARLAGGDGRRVFSSAPGTYGSGAEDLLQSSAWETAAEVGTAYLAAASHAFDAAGDPVAAAGAFAARVAVADALVHVGDDSARDLLEGSADAAFVGGFAAAAAALGNAPDLVVLDTTRPGRPVARPLSRAIARIVHGRAINPRYLAAQVRHGPRGAADLAETVDRLVGFAETTAAVAPELIGALFDAVVAPEAMREFVLRENPEAARAIARRFEGARRRGLWHPLRNSVDADLAALCDAADALAPPAGLAAPASAADVLAPLAGTAPIAEGLAALAPLPGRAPPASAGAAELPPAAATPAAPDPVAAVHPSGGDPLGLRRAAIGSAPIGKNGARGFSG